MWTDELIKIILNAWLDGYIQITFVGNNQIERHEIRKMERANIFFRYHMPQKYKS